MFLLYRQGKCNFKILSFLFIWFESINIHYFECWGHYIWKSIMFILWQANAMALYTQAWPRTLLGAYGNINLEKSKDLLQTRIPDKGVLSCQRKLASRAIQIRTYTIELYKSFQLGFFSSIRCSFQFLFHAWIFFSLLIASSISPYIS